MAKAPTTDAAPAAQTPAEQVGAQEAPSNELALEADTDAISVLQAQMEYVHSWMNEVAHILKRAGLVSVPEAVLPDAPLADEAQA